MEDFQSKNKGTEEDLRIVALGNTGAGKSHTGNTILRAADVLKTNKSASVSQECKSVTATVNGRTINYVDTPGLFDASRSQEQLRSEILRSIIKCAPGPHIFLIVLQVERYTDQEQEIVKKITETFGEEALNYAVVLFTHGDNLDNNQTIEEFVKENSQLQELVDRCGGRCHVIDNKYWNQQEDGYRSNRVQIKRLLNTVKEMVRASEGGCYTNEMLQLVQRDVDNNMQKVRAESNVRRSEEQIRQEAVERVHGNLVRLEVATRSLLHALLGIKDFIGLVAKKIKKHTCTTAPEVLPVKHLEVVKPESEVMVAVKEAHTGNKGDMKEQTVWEPVQQMDQDSTENKNAFLPLDYDQLGVMASWENIRDEPERAGPMEKLRVVALGKTGAGKSHTGNTILRAEKVFQTKCSPASVTQACKSITATVNRRLVKYVDTPGLFDTSNSQEHNEELLKSELLKSIIECAPGPHAFLIVLKVERYTDQEQEIVRKITETFGEEAFNYAVVLFTHGDNLDDDQTITEFVKENSQLQELVDRCGGRCHVIDNKYWNQQEDGYRSNRVQIKRLLNTINEMVRASGGGCYTNEMLQLVQRDVDNNMQEVRAESNVRWSEEQIRQEAVKRVHNKLMVKIAGVTTGVLLGALLGIHGLVRLLVQIFSKLEYANVSKIVAPLSILLNKPDLLTSTISAAKTGAVTVAAGMLTGAALVGAVKGAQMGYEAAEREETVLDAIKTTVQACTENGEVIGMTTLANAQR